MSVFKEIVAAYTAGEGDEIIRQSFGTRVTSASLQSLMSRARKQLGRPAQLPGRHCATRYLGARVPTNVHDALAAEACGRGITAEVLVCRLLMAIATDKIVGAVLDDSANGATVDCEPRPSRRKRGVEPKTRVVGVRDAGPKALRRST